MQYECSVCGHIYDEDAEGTPWSQLPDDWECPVCSADSSYFEAKGEAAQVLAKLPGIHSDVRGKAVKLTADPAKVHIFHEGTSLLYH